MRLPSWTALLLLLALVRHATGEDDARQGLAALRSARTVAQRLAAIRKLEASGAPRAAAALALLVAEDPEIEVRVGAAQALGRTRAPEAEKLLLERLVDGGPLAVRDAVAWALARKPHGARLVIAGLEAPGRTVLERGLLLRALGAFSDPGTRETLVTWARDPDPCPRTEAIRALCARSDAPEQRAALIGRLLAEAPDAGSVLAALDAAEPLLSPVMRPALERLTTYLEPAVADAARHLLQVLEARPVEEAPPATPSSPDDRYGTPTPPPPIRPPTDVPARSRHDLVYVLDATGSTVETLPALLAGIRHDVDLLVEQGLNLRVGVVVYRGGHGARARQGGLDVLPLDYDPARVREYLDGIEPGGVDDRGASVALALRLALDRMGWRRGARRTVHLIADGPCEDPADAIRRASIHYRAESTRTRVSYVRRTRGDVPDEYDRLAQAGGTGAAEVVE